MKIKSAILRLPLITLFVISYLAFVITPSSAASAPDPQPCKNAQDTELVNNYLIGEDGKPPIPPLTGYADVTGVDDREKPEDGSGGDIVRLAPKEFSFQVDFSKLQAVFGASNSNYLEGKFQDPTHGTANLLNSTSVELNQYNGAAEKTSAKILTDDLRKKYVDYVYNHPQLNESGNKYTDIENKGAPKTVYDLVNDYGAPNPPLSSATEEEKSAWLDTWGKYWGKLPTVWSEFYNAEIRFHYVNGDRGLDLAKIDSSSCPLRLEDAYVKFVMPEFYRTTAVSDQLNRQIVPKAAQSYQPHNTLPGTTSALNSIKNAFAYCWKLLTNPPKIINDLKKVVPVTLKILNPVKTVFAANPSPSPSPPSCLRIFKDSKNGDAPYCPLPQEELSRLGAAVSCDNKDDVNKLQKDNPNVVCTFRFTVSIPYQIDKFNATDCHNTGGDNYKCTPKVYIIPNFRIPWLAAIWNNTVDSEKGSGSDDSGRPGIYTFFTPKSVYSSLFPSQYNTALDLLKKCYPSWPEQTGGDQGSCAQLNAIGSIIPCRTDVTIEQLAECVSGKIDKTLPGQANTQGDKVKQKYIGATDCNKVFVRDIALKPLALQKSQNQLNQDGCDLTSTGNQSGSGSGNFQPPDCSDPSVQNPSDGNSANGIETSPAQLECYIVQVASGKTEKLSGDPLPDVMIRVMRLESGGSQCAVSSAAALGVFQFIASTWKSQPDSYSSDSGNGTRTVPESINAGQTCFGIPGPEPLAIQPVLPGGSNLYDWSLQFGGTNDGGAWDPFAQIRATAKIMETSGGCIWNPYQDLYPQNCNGFSPTR